MSRWQIVTLATVERIYYVDARDERAAEAVTTEMTSQIETDIEEETLSITAHDEQNAADAGRSKDD